MQPSLLLGAGAALAGLGLFLSVGEGAGASAATVPPPPPAAAGHFAFVVEGDRDQLTITHASAKPDPWAGVPKGFTSDWALSIRDQRGAELARVPLDLSKFDLSPQGKGKPRQVEGCIVHDSRVAMLANAPAFADAASYVFLRGETLVGAVDAAAVQKLAGGGR